MVYLLGKPCYRAYVRNIDVHKLELEVRQDAAVLIDATYSHSRSLCMR